MIVTFDLVPVQPGLSVLLAFLFQEPPVQLGVFDDDDTDEIDAACEEFCAEHQRHLH